MFEDKIKEAKRMLSTEGDTSYNEIYVRGRIFELEKCQAEVEEKKQKWMDRRIVEIGASKYIINGDKAMWDFEQIFGTLNNDKAKEGKDE